MQASYERIPLVGVLVQSLVSNGLYRRQGVLDAVLHLVHKQLLLLLSPLAIGDISRNFGSADDPAVGILERDLLTRTVASLSPPKRSRGQRAVPRLRL